MPLSEYGQFSLVVVTLNELHKRKVESLRDTIAQVILCIAHPLGAGYTRTTEVDCFLQRVPPRCFS